MNGKKEIMKDEKWVAFHRALEKAELEMPTSEKDIYGKWDAMNLWNKMSKGVSFDDFLQY